MEFIWRRIDIIQQGSKPLRFIWKIFVSAGSVTISVIFCFFFFFHFQNVAVNIPFNFNQTYNIMNYIIEGASIVLITAFWCDHHHRDISRCAQTKTDTKFHLNSRIFFVSINICYQFDEDEVFYTYICVS